MLHHLLCITTSDHNPFLQTQVTKNTINKKSSLGSNTELDPLQPTALD